MNKINKINKIHLWFKIISAAISAGAMILFFFLEIKSNGGLSGWVSRRPLLSVIYLLFFIGITMPVTKIFFGLYWRFLNKSGVIFGKRHFFISICVFLMSVSSFILSASGMSNMAFTSFFILLLSEFTAGERVILKIGSGSIYNIYYIHDMSISCKKVTGVDFIKNKKQEIAAVNIGLESKSKAKTLFIPVSPEEAEKIQKFLL